MVRVRDFFASAFGIVALVISILGAAFLVLGGGLVLGAVVSQLAEAPLGLRMPLWGIGIAFVVLGGLFTGVGLTLVRSRLKHLRALADLRVNGVCVKGTVTSLTRDLRVRVNRKHPWLVGYRYCVAGVDHDASERHFEIPPGLDVGSLIDVRYDSSDPTISVLELAHSDSNDSGGISMVEQGHVHTPSP